MSDVVNYVENFAPVGAGIGFGGSRLHEPPADYDKSVDPVFPGNTVIDDPVISVRGLTKSFGRKTVLEDISIDFPRGKITTVLGPSGTGKSVFLRNLIGLLTPDRGEIWVGEDDIPTLRRRRLLEVRKKFGVLFQDGALFGSMTIYDNVAFPLREHTAKSEREIKQIVFEKLELVGLEGAADLMPDEISGGMRKRAGLARALVMEPEILLFDEPDSGLDPVRTAYLNDLARDIVRELGSTIVIVTHHIPSAQQVADYVGMLFRRNLVAFGKVDDMFNSWYAPCQQFLHGITEGPIGMSEERDRPELL
ncbi:ABC transporter ATP-binding protein [Egicoccus sp. AB-alg2]|uniref:ABC transporter ATP-binding protein n=1 Tax=Egicoccus sp. AB-alg2 TaxID=3242693 RepID=UPI00359EE5DC